MSFSDPLTSLTPSHAMNQDDEELAVPQDKPAAPRQRPSLRMGTIDRKPWVSCSASAPVRRRKAEFYLIQSFDYRAACKRDRPMIILAKVVCNLRCYYLQDKENTVRMVKTYFNTRCWDDPWSSEAIGLIWECVEGYTPSLGLSDKAGIAKQKAQFLAREVAYLLESLPCEGRVLDKDLFSLFQEWNPDMEITSNQFSRAVSEVTGLSKTHSHSKRYWVGLHLPTVDENLGKAA